MAGIYVHIPFCKQACTYCDFHFSTSFSSYRKELIKAICDELEDRKTYLCQSITSIYLGGGTPSLLNISELEQIFKCIHTHFELESDCEITLEANPDDITEASLIHWKTIGINRLSIGIQSFRQEDLNWMNRAHSVVEAEACVMLAQKAGFDVLSVDLIYGLPGLSNEMWKQHLEKVISWGIGHISAYCLTVEERTVLHKLVLEKKILPAGEDTQSEQFDILSETLIQHGYDHYEISNFALPGQYAVHNSNYWKGAHYLGVGPSAHSFNGNSRRWNCANNNQYLQKKKDTWFETEILGTKERWNELILTGLRTSFGVDLNILYGIQEPSVEFSQKVSEYTEKELMRIIDSSLQLTHTGRLQADHLASELFI